MLQGVQGQHALRVNKDFIAILLHSIMYVLLAIIALCCLQLPYHVLWVPTLWEELEHSALPARLVISALLV